MMTDESLQIELKDEVDILEIYFEEIAREPLLNAEEEIELIKKVKNGDKEAKDKFINSNLKLVVWVAKRYMNNGLEFQDLIQEGNLGLMIAVEKFDPDMGNRFSTYAFHCIRQSIIKAFSNSARFIKIPAKSRAWLRLLNKIKYQLSQEYGRTPTEEEIANASPDPEKAYAILNNSIFWQEFMVSLDEPLEILEYDDGNLYDILANENSSNPCDEYVKKIANKELRDIISNCSERERKIIESRFGLDGKGCHTLEEIGDELGITRERVRKIADRTLRNLRKTYKP